ncbi:integrase core domain-containing protein [Microbacterium sediminicola]|uniref:Integrase core domain-containing protein n=1 Tax=Microbacterium sediminicola TaxID=415210 RepID=A0ABN2I9N0_9MICO
MIAQWPPDAPRGSVTTFCAEHGVSRKTFYEIRRRALVDGQAAALEPRSRRPRSSPNRLTDEVKQQAIGVRSALESSGLDHGPISVHEKSRSLGMDAPSVASLARIFRDAGVARTEPRKKPRASFRRFVYPAPNACWQLDATEYVLAGGRKCVIFQLIDDHSRYAVASHVAWGETSKDAIAVVKKGIAAHGVPQRLLSDNGLALNPSRRGILGQLVAHVTALGVEPITGKPGKPTTQGKNERFHQTLFRYLDKQPLAGSLVELQEQVDAFDQIYNVNRPHQALPGRATPQAVWDATPTAEPPRPLPAEQRYAIPKTGLIPPPQGRAVNGIRVATVHLNGTIKARGIWFNISHTRRGQDVLVTYEREGIMIFDLDGTLIIEHPWPAPGVKYVGNGKPRGPRKQL